MAKPLKILLIGDHQALVESLIAGGHQAEITLVHSDYDLILGPTCCRFLPGMEAYLPTIIKGVRAVKYPKKEKA